MKKIVILTGAGISAESGLRTFRDSGGLWEGHDVQEVASPEGWRRNRELVLDFYNQRRRQLFEVEPNAAHKALAELEERYETWVITQNVDDLHERGGSTNVLHLHGELRKARSTLDSRLVYDWDKDINLGDFCERGAQLRPHIVWFGESVPMIEPAVQLSIAADIYIVIGTSMQVYPAAGLMNPDIVAPEIPKYFIDPNPSVSEGYYANLTILSEPATTGVRKIVDQLLML